MSSLLLTYAAVLTIDRFGPGLQLQNVDDAVFYRTDKRDVVKLDQNISECSLFLVSFF